jgi:FLVCR family MFS transporter
MSSVSETNFRERSMSFPVYKLYRRRFYVLFVYSFLSFNQCLFWITFSPISESAEKHYSISESTVDLLIAWGPILFIPCLPLTYILLNKRNGLRYCILLLSTIGLVSTIIRIIPLLIVSPSSAKYHSISVPFLHFGQILNAICGPLAMAPVSQLSSLWFDTNERTRSTTVAIMSYNLGSTIGFILGPFVVYSPSKLPNLLYIHVGLSLIGFILSWIYFPGEPPIPPSPAAQLLMNKPIDNENLKSWRSYTINIEKTFKNRSFVLLVCGGALIGGTYGAWTALFETIFEDENYSESESGWFGFCSNIAEIIGGLIISFVADQPRFNRSFKLIIMISYTFYFFSICWFNLSIKSIFKDKSIIPSNRLTIGISVTLAGFFQGSSSPLIYESLAEFIYPAPESLSASILVQFINITSLILFFIAPNRSKLINFIILIIIFISIIFILLTKFVYKRKDADKIKRNTLIPDDEPSEPSIDPLPQTFQMDTISVHDESTI